MSAWTVIKHEEVGSGGVASITFSSIPATYTDLVLTFSARNNTGGAIDMTFNGNAANYSERLLYGEGSGSGLSASRSSADTFVWLLSNLNSRTANTFSSGQVYIPNYAGNTNKSISAESVTENNATAAEVYIDAGLWGNTAAITSIKVENRSGTFLQYSSFTLYGITKGSSGGVTVS